MYRCLITGPRTAKMPQGTYKSDMLWTAGKKSIAKAYDFNKVLPQTICYVAVLVPTFPPVQSPLLIFLRQARFSLDALAEWNDQDGEFVYEAFFDNLMEMFEDEEWAKGVLDWYNVYVVFFSLFLCMLTRISVRSSARDITTTRVDSSLVNPPSMSSLKGAAGAFRPGPLILLRGLHVCVIGHLLPSR